MVWIFFRMVQMKRIVRKILKIFHLGSIYDFLSSTKAVIHLHLEKRAMRRNYDKIVRRIKKYPHTRKIRVTFLVTETAKWKVQSLYNEMRSSKDFEPFVVLSAPIDDIKFYGEELKKKLDKDKAFYERMGCCCYTNFDFVSHKSHSLSIFSPDIVFYQEPRLFSPEENVAETAKFALCCDIPYAIRTVGGGTVLQNTPFYHQLMYLQFPPTKAQSCFYRKELPEWKWAGTSYAVGHPILDRYEEIIDEPSCNEDRYVIYAPHFSFPVSGVKRIVTLSSFLDNGREILEYAKTHRQFKWLFKPHPLLYGELIRRRIWTREEVDAYYKEWEKIGEVCLDGDYIKVFKCSRVLITDCGSFLVEYPITGHPLIRLIPKEIDYPVFPIFNQLYASFYSVHNLEQMYLTFESVVERGEDPRKNERMKAVQELGLINKKSSAERIMEKLKQVCGR